ncbi:oxidoreductase, partial [Salmonella enterica]|nr:oxidoreductase [Salmonella enterica]
MKSLLIVALCTFIVAFYQNSFDDNSSYNKTVKLNRVS